MTLDDSRAWFGLLSEAPDSVATTFRSAPSLKTLLARGWKPEQTLLYLPRKREGYDSSIAVAARTLNIDEDRSIIWIFSTIGLCTLQQERQGEAQAFQHIEIVIVSNNSERDDPFPARLGIALAQEPNSLAGWDWGQVAPPPLLDWISIAGQELGAAIRRGTGFSIGDTLTLGPGNAEWTRSKLDHSVLLPAAPPMLMAGMAPFDSTSTPRDVVNPINWHSDPGAGRYAYGFYWLLPVSGREYATATATGTWNMFADLVECAHGTSKDDDFATAFDLLRQ
jgi:hypothetical protein